MKGFAEGLALKQRRKATRKSAIMSSATELCRAGTSVARHGFKRRVTAVPISINFGLTLARQ